MFDVCYAAPGFQPGAARMGPGAYTSPGIAATMSRIPMNIKYGKNKERISRIPHSIKMYKNKERISRIPHYITLNTSNQNTIPLLLIIVLVIIIKLVIVAL